MAGIRVVVIGAGGIAAAHLRAYAAQAARKLTGSIIGEGLVDLAAVRAVMDGAGYAGWWSLEYEGSEDALNVGVPRSLAAARSMLA